MKLGSCLSKNGAGEESWDVAEEGEETSVGGKR